MHLQSPNGLMLYRGMGTNVHSRRDSRTSMQDEEGLTAVIEFLSAFVLFLIVLTAFLSLAGLQMGSNLPQTDRIDEYSIQGLQILTGESGWFVPHDEFDVRDIANSTRDWHMFNASVLITGDLRPGLARASGELEQVRLNGLSNITEHQFVRGLGLPDWASVNLTLTVVESSNSSRVGTQLFQDGANRRAGGFSATSSRLLLLGDEIVLVTLEVHDAGRTSSHLRVTEFMADPALGTEWVEVENPDGFAVNMSGWSLRRDSDNGISSLIGDGALGGGDVMLCSGRPSLQPNLGADLVFDLGASGVLGRGAIDGLEFSQDGIKLLWTFPGTLNTVTMQHIQWDPTWDIDEDESYTWSGGDWSQAANWTVSIGGTPGSR